MFDLFVSVLSQEVIGWEERLRNDLFCVKTSTQSINLNPVHTSNNIIATLPNATKSIASTLLLLWTGLKATAFVYFAAYTCDYILLNTTCLLECVCLFVCLCVC